MNPRYVKLSDFNDLKGLDLEMIFNNKPFFIHNKPQKQNIQNEINLVNEVLKTTIETFTEESAKLNSIFERKIKGLEEKLQKLKELAEKQEAENKNRDNRVLLITSPEVFKQIQKLFANSKFEFFYFDNAANKDGKSAKSISVEQLAYMSHIFIEVLHDDTSSINLYHTIQKAIINYTDVKLTPISIPKHIGDLKDSIVMETIKTVLGKQNGNN